MSWVVWRQGRAENILLLALIGAIAALLVLTGAHMRSVFDSSGLAACTGNPETAPPSCSLLVNAFQTRFDAVNQLGPWLALAPGLFGVLLAVPFVLELDQGTYRLAWSQSLTPRRWLTTRLALLFLGSVICGVALIAVATWWRHPLDLLGGRIGPNQFDVEGIVPIAYTLFAAAVVLVIGTVTRRTGLAAAGGFGAYLVVRLVMRSMRDHLIAPIHALIPAPRGPGGILHAWVIGHGFTNANGHPIPTSVINGCFNAQANLSSACLIRNHVYQSFVYEPPSRFWPLQGIEAAIFLALSLVLIGLAVWWIKHRIA